MRSNVNLVEGSRKAAPSLRIPREERIRITGNSQAINDQGHMNHITRLQKFLLGLFVAIASLGHLQAQTAGMGTYYAHPTTEVVVPIMTSGLDGVAAVSMFVEYDPAAITFLGVLGNTLDASIFDTQWPDNKRRVGISWSTTEPPAAFPSTLLSLRFTYVTGSSTLVFSESGSAVCELALFDGSIVTMSYTSGAVEPCPVVSAPTAGNIIACFDGMPKTGSATVGLGETVIWYTATTGGSVTSAPSRTSPGTSSAYAGALNTTTGCEGLTRTLVTVIVYELPTGEAAGGGVVCFGQTEEVTFTFTGVAPYTFSYSGPGGTTISNYNSSSYTFQAAPGTYALTALSDANSPVCAATALGSPVSVTLEVIPPAIDDTDKQDLTVECGLTFTATVSAWLADNAGATATDNCGSVTWTNDFNINNLSDGCGDSGSLVVTFTAADASGNTSSTTATFTIQDTTVPVVSTEAGSLNATLQCSDTNGIAAAQALAPDATDNCTSDLTLNEVSDNTVGSLACANAYVRTRVWNFTDACGNTSANFTQVITVIDNTAPVLTAGTIAPAYASVALAEAAAIAATVATDNCTPLGAGNYSASTVGICSATITVSVNDGCGNSSSVTYNTAIDNEAPVITSCPTVVDVTNNFGSCTGTVEVPAPTWTDNCEANTSLTYVITGATTGSGTGAVGTANFNSGTSTVTYTVSDGLNVATCVVTVMVIDTQTPVVGCPTNQTRNSDAGQCYATITAGVNLALPNGLDNCSLPADAFSYRFSGPINSPGYPDYVAGTINAVQFIGGVYTITYRVVDGGGNVATCNFTLTVNDISAPVINCGTLTRTFTTDAGQCSAEVIAAAIAPALVTLNTCDTYTYVALDAANVVIASGSVSALTSITFPKGTNTITYTVSETNAPFRTVNCTVTVVVNDEEVPSIPEIPGDVVVNNDLDVCGAPVTWVEPAGEDNCPGHSIAQTAGLANGSVFPIGTSTVTYTATDASGNTTSASFMVTVNDTQAPVVIGTPANITVSNDAGACGAMVNYIAPTSGDNCTGHFITRTAGLASGSFFPVGTTSVTYTATDASNNTTSSSFTVTVNDTEAPVITLLAVTPTTICQGLPYSDAGASATDNCAVDITDDIIVTGLPINTAIPGTYTVFYNVSDAAGNPAGTVTRTVTVQPKPAISGTVTSTNGFSQVMTSGNSYAHTTCDDQDVTTSVPTLTSSLATACGTLRIQTQIISTLPNIASQTVDMSYAQAQLVGPTTISPQNFTGSVGTITFLSTPYYDVNNNGQYDAGVDVDGEVTTFVLTVQPKPVVSNTVTTVAGYNQTMVSGQSYDHTICSGEEITTTAVSLTSTLANACGPLRVRTEYISTLPNIASQTLDQPYSILSVLPPTTISPTNITGQDQTITFVTTPYYDVNGNGSYDAGVDVDGELTTFVLTVRSELQLTCPADITVYSPANGCAVQVAFAATVAGTPAPGVIYSINGTTITSPHVFPVGTTTVDVDVTNACASLDCSFTVTVNDTISPTIQAPLPVSVSADAGACTTDAENVDLGLPTVADNCISTTVTNNAPATFPLGTTTITWVVEDASGNTASAIQLVTVTDDEDPILIGVPANANAGCDAIPAPPEVSATDNCDGAPVVDFVEESTQHASLTNVGHYNYIITRTWTATDVTGNSSTGVQVITVSDTQAPELTGVPFNASASCDSIPMPAEVTAEDNCDPAPVVVLSTVSTQDVNPANLGHYSYTITHTWTATDVAGNSSTSVQVITVSDTEDPLLAGVPNDIDASCDAIPAPAEVTATDNCDEAPEVVLVEESTQHASVTNMGHYNYIITRTWTATDVTGNSSTGVQVITVSDTQAPELMGVPSNVSASCDNIPTPAEVTATDNCDAAPVISFNEVSTQDTDVTEPGHYNYTITRTWTATDVAGNTTSEVQVITVSDTQAPFWSNCPANISIENNLGDCSQGTAFWTAPTVADNCDANPNVTVPSWASGALFPAGITTVTYSAVDVSGNIGTCSFTVEVYIVDTDGDGVCNADDCNPNDANLTFPGASCDDGDPSTFNDTVSSQCTCVGTPYVELAVKVLLDGPYNEADDLMNDGLRAAGLLPLAQPYGTAPFNYSGTETVLPAVFAVTGDDAIVDWLLLELRNPTTPSVIVARRAVLLQRDGDVVDLDGTSPVRFVDLLGAEFHVAVRHRNHLAVMTALAPTISHLPAIVDFTSTGYANYGTSAANALNAQKTRDGSRMLWGGNTLHDGVVKYAGANNDRDPILVAIGGLVPTTVVTNVYNRMDMNMDGQIKYAGAANDRDPILVNLNGNAIGQRFQQLP
jgi:large repetitive protein